MAIKDRSSLEETSIQKTYKITESSGFIPQKVYNFEANDLFILQGFINKDKTGSFFFSFARVKPTDPVEVQIFYYSKTQYSSVTINKRSFSFNSVLDTGSAAKNMNMIVYEGTYSVWIRHSGTSKNSVTTPITTNNIDITSTRYFLAHLNNTNPSFAFEYQKQTFSAVDGIVLKDSSLFLYGVFNSNSYYDLSSSYLGMHINTTYEVESLWGRNNNNFFAQTVYGLGDGNGYTQALIMGTYTSSHNNFLMMALFDPFYGSGENGIKYLTYTDFNISLTGNFYQYNSTYCYVTYSDAGSLQITTVFDCQSSRIIANYQAPNDKIESYISIFGGDLYNTYVQNTSIGVYYFEIDSPENV